MTEPVLVEVLAGARTEACVGDLRRLLLPFDLYSVDRTADFEAAARIYRRCRQRRITPWGLVDCLIAGDGARI